MLRPIYRYLRRQIANARLRRKYRGLILDDAVVAKTELGSFNLICNDASISNSVMGDFSYIGIGTRISNTSIGKFCGIGPGVIVNPGIHPSRDFVSAHPTFYSTSFRCHNRFAEHQAIEEHGHVNIEHDVWIGANVIILPNITVGTGAIIAAGAVVTKNVEPYTIVGGVPAKRIRFRFEPEQIEKLLASEWWNWDFERLKQRHLDFHSYAQFEKMLKASEENLSS